MKLIDQIEQEQQRRARLRERAAGEFVLGFLLTLFFLVLLFGAADSEAASVSYAGVCYPTESDASDALIRDFPRISTSGSVPMEFQLLNPIKMSSGLYYKIRSINLSTSAVTDSVPELTTFSACTYQSSYTTRDILFAGLIVFALALGAIFGMLGG